jgi:hypothetical protein
MDLMKLRDTFPEKDLEWRVLRAGVTSGRPWAQLAAYVDARAVQDRLDEVCGPGLWGVIYQRISDKGFLAGLSIKVGDEWVTKWDGSEDTDMEPFKGGISKALVRVASVWGIGRYLYELPRQWAKFVDANTEGAREVKVKVGGSEQTFYWTPPSLSSSSTTPRAPSVSSSKAPASTTDVTSRETSVEQDVRAVFGPEVTVEPGSPPSFGDPGSIVISFGKFKGKQIKDVPTKDLFSYINFLKESAAKERKQPGKNVIDLEKNANAYFSARPQPELSPIIDDVPF